VGYLPDPARTKKMQEAKTMAEKDISKYRLKQEEIFLEDKAKLYERSKRDEEKVKSQSNSSGTIESDFMANKDKVISDLMDRILTVNLDVPRVVKGNFK